MTRNKCDKVEPEDRLVMYWQSHEGGCLKVPDGVTHVVFTFALVESSVVAIGLQGNDDTLKQCCEAPKTMHLHYGQYRRSG